MLLTDNVTQLKYVSSKYEKLLNKLGIFTIKDLLTYFPRSYLDTTNIVTIKNIYEQKELDKNFLIRAKVLSYKNVFIPGGRSIQTAEVEDETGELKCMFFNQRFLKNVFKTDKTFLIYGKVKPKGNSIIMYPTNYEEDTKERENIHLGRISPEYRLTTGLSKKWLRNRIKSLVDLIENDEIKIPNEIKIPEYNKNIIHAHFPDTEQNLQIALKNLTIAELTNIHLKILNTKKPKQKSKINIDPINYAQDFNKFLKNLSFELTPDQEKVLNKLTTQIVNKEILNALIQGDVGSGKTIIAVLLSLIMAKNGYQTVVLAPTTVLAEQHYKTFTQLLNQFNIRVELVTSSNKNTIAEDVLIGTSAVLARKQNLIKNIGLIVIDEQHRFGVEQREELLTPFKKALKNIPHFLNMTATPIPRTIAETFFTDLEVAEINTKPLKRKDIKTFIVPPEKRENSFRWIIKEILSKNEQVYWVCPLIEESETKEINSVKKIHAELKKVFKNFKVELLHGKMKPVEKNEIMEKFRKGIIDVLVSTSVIEVGVDVANATVMVIENAERFGLAQLHQIRGRVGRSDKQSYCFIFTGSEITEIANKRLEFFQNNTNGLKIAEFDLQLRGPGEVYGTKQSGIPDLKIAKLNNLEQIKKSKKIALNLFKNGIKKIELFS